ncbi:MAG: hypothetical protein AAF648_00835 [Pseudomonadota bacterium]
MSPGLHDLEVNNTGTVLPRHNPTEERTEPIKRQYAFEQALGPAGEVPVAIKG